MPACAASRSSVSTKSQFNRVATRLPTVDLPAPDRPVKKMRCIKAPSAQVLRRTPHSSFIASAASFAQPVSHVFVELSDWPIISEERGIRKLLPLRLSPPDREKFPG